MPARDKTGPKGEGPKTGRGFGPCGGEATGFGRGFGKSRQFGRGRHRGRGFGRGFGRRYFDTEIVELSEEEQIKILEEEKKAIEDKLGELKDAKTKEA